jgi:hypothetical protein
MDKVAKTTQAARSEWNLVKIVFIVVSALAAVYFVTSVLALIFPGHGIPFLWMAFPLGPQPPPLP